jgi:hypothetical protein
MISPTMQSISDLLRQRERPRYGREDALPRQQFTHDQCERERVDRLTANVPLIHFGRYVECRSHLIRQHEHISPSCPAGCSEASGQSMT